MLAATRRIKLMLVIPTLDQSGAEKQLTLLACRLPGDEFDVHVVALTRGGPFADELARHNIRLTVLGKRWKFDPAALWRLRRLIASEQPDIVHSWLFAANAYSRLLVGRRMRSRPKLVVSERCVDVWKAGWQLWLDQRLIGRTDRLVGNSAAVAEFYQTIGYRPEQVTVIANGIDLPDLTTVDRAALRAEFDLPVDAPVVGFIGRLAKQKRLDVLVFATALLAIIRPDVCFLLVGDGPERDALMKFARDINIEDRICFAGHRPDAARLLAAMDLFWIASDFEGQSNSVMEAMAAGLPVIASDIPPNRELVIDGETGFLVKVGDRVGFQQFADRLLADRELAQRLGTAGRERMRQHFSIDRMVSEYARLYRELLK
jgi:glycosyltransferase involved in cell wall biosynthesis